MTAATQLLSIDCCWDTVGHAATVSYWVVSCPVLLRIYHAVTVADVSWATAVGCAVTRPLYRFVDTMVEGHY